MKVAFCSRSCVCVFSTGNVIRYFVMRALQLPPEAWLRTAAYNASITVLHIHPSGRVSLYGFGDVGRLPPHLITYN